MANFQPIPWLKVSDDVGLPLAGGKIWTYQSGTTTPKTTYSDTALTVANTNPIVLNARGEAQMALAPGAYSLKLLRADDTLIKTIDNVTDGAAAAIVLSAAGVALIRADLADSAGSGSIGFIGSSLGVVARTVQDKLRELVSAKDFGAVGDGVTDDTAKLQLFINHLCNTGASGYLPAGTYKTTAKLTTTYGKNFTLVGSALFTSSIKAFHTDHILQSNYTYDYKYLTLLRESSFLAGSMSAGSAGFWTDDTGGIITGAAYSKLDGCVASSVGYYGMVLHGTAQSANRSTANFNKVGIGLRGALHRLYNCTTENNAITALYAQGNGMIVDGHYADGNCSSATAGYGVITNTGTNNSFAGGGMNDNNGAEHYYIKDCSKVTLSGRPNFYLLTGNNGMPRITIAATTQDVLDIETAFVARIKYAGSSPIYKNTYALGSVYDSSVVNPKYSNLTPTQTIHEMSAIIPTAVNGSYYLLPGGVVGSIAGGLPQQFFIPPAPAPFLNTKVRLLAVQCASTGGGASQVISIPVRVRDVTNNTDLATLMTFAGNEEYGLTQKVESFTAGLVDIPSGISWNIYVLAATGTAHNLFVRVLYSYVSDGTYA